MPPKNPAAPTGAENEQSPEAPTAADAKPKSGMDAPAAGGATRAKQPRTHIRLVCTRPNAGTRINGVAFAPVRIGEDTLHLSERLVPEQAAQLFRVSGFHEWEGDEDEHARAIEDALRQAAAAVAGTPEAHTANEARAIDELQASNRRLSTELAAARRLNEEQADTIRKLSDDLRKLNERGVRAA